jgi:hypothetical protein
MSQKRNSGLSKMTWTTVVALVSVCGLSHAPAQEVAPVGEASAHSTQTSPLQVISVQSAGLPDSPGAILAKAQQQQSQQNASASQADSQASPDSSSSKPQTNQSAPSGSNPSRSPQKPVGAAAAEAPNASGIAASQPAGVAIAPAKQRRVRTIVLKTGAIVGACVAVGAVVALTAGTSSKPPGAH